MGSGPQLYPPESRPSCWPRRPFGSIKFRTCIPDVTKYIRNEPQLFIPTLFAAISTHGGKCLELLLQEGALVNAMALDGRTPLHLTAIHGRHARAEPLLEHGASIDAVDKDANTPLHIASLNGHELLIRTLLSHKAEPSVYRNYSAELMI